MIGGEKKDMWWSHAAEYINQLNENSPAKAQTRQEERKEICGGYSQLNISNNSMKTHWLKHRQDRRREKHMWWLLAA